MLINVQITQTIDTIGCGMLGSRVKNAYLKEISVIKIFFKNLQFMVDIYTVRC